MTDDMDVSLNSFIFCAVSFVFIFLFVSTALSVIIWLGSRRKVREVVCVVVVVCEVVCVVVVVGEVVVCSLSAVISSLAAAAFTNTGGGAPCHPCTFARWFLPPHI